MRYKLLGKSGLRVSELALGTMTFGETWGWGASKTESKKQLDLYRDKGGNFIDTAVNYTDGSSEEIIGDLIEDDRDYWVVATKYTLTKPDSLDPNSGGNSRKNMMKSLERSLKRLKTDYVDILYLHMWDYMTSVEEVMRGLDDLVRMGKVNYIAISDSPSYIVAEANTLAELRGWSRFLGLQVPYSLLDRAVERALIPTAKHWDMALLPWGLLEAGVLTGKFLNASDEPTRVNRDKYEMSERVEKIVMEVKAVAEESGHSMAQVAINWVRQQKKAQMLPILGARTAKQLEDNLACLDWALTDEQWQRLDEVAKIDLGFPHGFLDANPYIYGATHDKIDNHRA